MGLLDLGLSAAVRPHVAGSPGKHRHVGVAYSLARIAGQAMHLNLAPIEHPIEETIYSPSNRCSITEAGRITFQPVATLPRPGFAPSP